ncbi:MAG: orotidine-5'-phosphate decarboxylase [Gemmatimonadota bacterium]
MKAPFESLLAQAVQANRSLLCVGLDPVPERLPEHLRAAADPVLEFNRGLIEATADLVCAYKPNFAFYGALGRGGWDTLKATIEAVPGGLPVIVDAKVGDIGSTAERYARMFFDELGADALTVNPYMGRDAVAPFLGHAGRGVFLLCLTSNPGADDFEKQPAGEERLYERVARKAVEWGAGASCGLVVGATQPGAIAGLRALAPELPFLVPGVGAQGGDLEAAVGQGKRADGAGVLINASRAVTYASGGRDYADAARAAALSLRDQINQHR